MWEVVLNPREPMLILWQQLKRDGGKRGRSSPVSMIMRELLYFTYKTEINHWICGHSTCVEALLGFSSLECGLHIVCVGVRGVRGVAMQVGRHCKVTVHWVGTGTISDNMCAQILFWNYALFLRVKKVKRSWEQKMNAWRSRVGSSNWD